MRHHARCLPNYSYITNNFTIKSEKKKSKDVNETLKVDNILELFRSCMTVWKNLQVHWNTDSV